MNNINDELIRLRQENLLRTINNVEERSGIEISCHNKKYINFSSNDYLGLSENPLAINAMYEAAKEVGVGATASRLICGNTNYHNKTEKILAQLKNRDKALLFPTGYMTNLAIFSTLAGENDAIILDRLSHASMIDAAKLSKAKLLVFEHNNPDNLKKVLEKYANKFSNVFVATEAVFSMDGDIAPIPEILEICNHHNAYLIVDEAHSTGVLGETGRGIEEHFNIKNKIHLIMGTCSKAIGAQGGFVAGDGYIIDYLITRARPFIYTTGISPAICAAVYENVKAIIETPQMIKDYHDNISYLETKILMSGLNINFFKTSIFPLIVGSSKDVMEKAKKIKEQNILAVAIREPTVPKNSARIRFTITNQHELKDIDSLINTLKTVEGID